MELKTKRQVGVSVKGFPVLLKSLDLSLGACEQKALGRGGRWAPNTNILSLQLSLDWFR